MFKTYNINLSLFKSLMGLLNNLNSFIVFDFSRNFSRIISTALNYLATMSFDAEFHFASTIVCLIDSRPLHPCERIRDCLARVRQTYGMKLHQMSMLK